MTIKIKYGIIITAAFILILSFSHNTKANDLSVSSTEVEETIEESTTTSEPIPYHDDGNNDGCG